MQRTLFLSISVLAVLTTAGTAHAEGDKAQDAKGTPKNTKRFEFKYYLIRPSILASDLPTKRHGDRYLYEKKDKTGQRRTEYGITAEKKMSVYLKFGKRKFNVLKDIWKTPYVSRAYVSSSQRAAARPRAKQPGVSSRRGIRNVRRSMPSGPRK